MESLAYSFLPTPIRRPGVLLTEGKCLGALHESTHTTWWRPEHRRTSELHSKPHEAFCLGSPDQAVSPKVPQFRPHTVLRVLGKVSRRTELPAVPLGREWRLDTRAWYRYLSSLASPRRSQHSPHSSACT